MPVLVVGACPEEPVEADRSLGPVEPRNMRPMLLCAPYLNLPLHRYPLHRIEFESLICGESSVEGLGHLWALC